MTDLDCEGNLKYAVIKLRETEGPAVIEWHLSEERDEQIWREERGEGMVKALCCSNSPLGMDRYFRVDMAGWRRTKTHEREQKNQEERKKNLSKKVGEGRLIFQVMIWCAFIPVVFICHLSQGFIIISSAKLLWHIWRLPLNAAANNAGGAQRAAIHSPPQVAIHIKTSEDMRRKEHILKPDDVSHAHAPTHPFNRFHPACGFCALPARSVRFY